MKRRQKSGATASAAAIDRAHSRIWPYWLVLFAIALVVRLAHLAYLRDTPLWSTLLGDAAGYDAWARRIAAGDWVGTGVFYQAPLYPYVMGALYRVFGPEPGAIRLIQAALSSFSVVLLAEAGHAFFGRRAGFLAGAWLALSGPAIFFDGILQKTSFDVFFLCLLLFALSRIPTQRSNVFAILGGAATGALVLTRENALILLPVVLAWTFAVERPKRKLSVIVLCAMLAVLTPVAVRNRIAGGEWHLTTSQFGPNLYIGNHEWASGTYEPLRAGRGNAAFEQQDAKAIAETRLGRSLGPGEVSAYWTREAWSWMSTHPADWMALTGRKIALALDAVEAMDTEDIYSHGDESPILAWLTAIFGFGVLAPLATAGFVITRRRIRETWVLHAMAGAYLASLIMFYVVARYRLPLVPILALFAGAALSDGRTWWRAARTAERCTLLALVVLFGVFSNVSGSSPDAMRSLTQYNLADALRRSGYTDDAIVHLRESIRFDSGNAGALSNLGALLAERGAVEEAGRLYEQALAADPRNVSALNNLAQLEAGRGQADAAVARLKRAQEIDPMDAAAHRNLGLILASSGDASTAIREFQVALSLDPGDAATHNNLGIVLASSGRIGEAVSHFETASRLDPGLVQAQANLMRARDLLQTPRKTPGSP